jgi:two-component system CheB/CheR fusion protein
VGYDHLVEDIQGVLNTLAPQESEVQTGAGAWYLMRILPYRTLENVIEGAVLTFVDITTIRKTQQALADARDFAQAIVATVREPLLVLSDSLHVVSANRSFCRVFETSPKETEGRLLYELGDGQWDIPRLRQLLGDILPEQTVLDDFEVAHEFPGLGKRIMLLNGRRLSRNDDEDLILLAIEDVTDQAVEVAGLASNVRAQRERKDAGVDGGEKDK